MITISALGCPPGPPQSTIRPPPETTVTPDATQVPLPLVQKSTASPEATAQTSQHPRNPGASPPLLTVGSLEDLVKGPAPDNQTLPATLRAVRTAERAGNVHHHHQPLAASLPGPAAWTRVSHAREPTGTAKICSKWPGQPVIVVPSVPRMRLDCTHLKQQPVSSPRDPGQHRAAARTLRTELPFAWTV